MISIIIVHYNNPDELDKCLKSFCKVQLAIPTEFIIIDNGSQAKTKKIVEYYKERLPINYIRNKKNLGYARAVNQGIRMAQGDYLLIINSDILITPGAIERMHCYLEMHQEVGILAPQLLNLDNTIQYSCFRFPKFWTPIIRRTFLKNLPFGRREMARYLMLDFDHLTEKDVDWVLGAVMMVNKRSVEKVGMMDERFFLYFEDVDWCRRFSIHGFKIVYLPEAKFYHRYPRHSAQGVSFIFNKFFWHHLISGLKYLLKWFKPNT